MSSKIKKVILMGRKPGAAQALEYVLDAGISVPFVVAQKDEAYEKNLYQTASGRGIRVISDRELYELIEQKHKDAQNVDLVISYLFWNRIKKPLIDVARLGCVNFHPAPLPDYKGRAGYNTAILDQRASFGVSSHYIDSEDFDSGPIIKVLTFPMDPNTETALSLEATSQIKLYKLFEEVMGIFIRGEEIVTTPNKGGTYLTAEELESLKEVDLEKDSPEVIDRKIRAFFFPPHTGATITVNGQKHTLANDAVLKLLSKKLRV